VNTNQIIRALRDWSPFGLCDGTLIKQNGKREKTVGCAQGALAMSFVHSPTGRAWLRKKGHKVKGFRLHDFVGGQSLGTGEFAQAVAKHFGTTTVVLSTIMHFNDSINTGSTPRCPIASARRSSPCASGSTRSRPPATSGSQRSTARLCN
jgi:hypothetical protein